MYLQKALEITEEMMKDARNGNWDGLAQLDSKRQLVLEKAFAGKIYPEEAETMAEFINHILKINQELVSLSSKKRDSYADGLKKISTGRRARKAYSQVVK